MEEQEQYPIPKLPKFPKPQTQKTGVDMNHQEVCAPPTYDQATQPLNVEHAINVHQDIASILDKHIDTDSWRTPKLEKLSVQTKCRTCNNEIYTRVEEECLERTNCTGCDDHCFDNAYDCKGIIVAIFCFCLFSIICSLIQMCKGEKDGSKVYRHFCPACNALIGEYKPKRRSA